MNAFFEQLENRTLRSATISSAQEANLEKLASDLKAIHATSDVTATQVHALDDAIVVALESATSEPSASSVSAFKAELKTALASGPLTAIERKDLAIDFDAILTSAGVSTADAKAVGTDIKAIAASAHFTTADGQEIWGDLEAIVTTYQANH